MEAHRRNKFFLLLEATTTARVGKSFALGPSSPPSLPSSLLCKFFDKSVVRPHIQRKGRKWNAISKTHFFPSPPSHLLFPPNGLADGPFLPFFLPSSPPHSSDLLRLLLFFWNCISLSLFSHLSFLLSIRYHLRPESSEKGVPPFSSLFPSCVSWGAEGGSRGRRTDGRTDALSAAGGIRPDSSPIRFE